MSRRRVSEPPLYNVRRLREKPYPIPNPNRTNVHKQGKPSQVNSSKVATPTQNQASQKHASQQRSVQQQKRSDRLDTLDDVSDIQIDTPPNSPILIPQSKNDDVICLTPNIRGHKPFADFDVISGRYPFTVKKVF